MATNTVEATLRSHYSDGVSRSVETTRRTLEQNMAMMRNAGVAMSRGIGAAFEHLASKAEYWSRLASQVAGSTEDSFKRMIMSSRLWSMGIVAALGAVTTKITEFLISAAKDASDLTELKIVYEGLTRTVGWHADTLAKLKSATEGLVGSTDLLKNSNRVMQSGIKISDAQYIQLTENVFRLAKAARVDGAQALNMLTDALIKGNARGFQAIGIHINVKDAISEMAMATGQHTTALQDSARMQAFYNELLQKTGEAAAKLPADFLSFQDALTRLEKIWQGYRLSVGEAINRSEVFQQMNRRVLDSLSSFADKQKDVTGLAKNVNEFILGALDGLAKLIDILGWFASAWDLAWATAKTVVNAAGVVITGVLYLLQLGFVSLLRILGKLPGETGRFFRSAAEDAQYYADYFGEATKQFGLGFINAFSGIGENQAKLDQFAATTRVLAGDLAKFVNQVAAGTAGTRQQGDAASAAAEQQKKLNEQVKKYADLQKELQSRNMSPEAKAMSDLANMLRQIESLTEISEDKKNNLRRMAYKAWLAEQLKLTREAANKEYEIATEIQNLIRAVSTSGAGNLKDWKTPSVLGGQQPKNLGDDLAYRNSRDMDLARRKEFEAIQNAARLSAEKNIPEILRPYKELYAELQRFNTLNLSPFQETLKQFKSSVIEIGTKVTEAWSSFWADMVSGQENAGKKFLAALLNIFAKELLAIAVKLTAYSIMNAVLGNWGGAARMAAAAASIGALAGVLTGYASSLAETNSAGSGGTYQNISSPTSSTVQVINVGAAGRAQNAGEASSAGASTVVGELVVRLDRGVIVDEVKSNIRRNGTLRTVIQNA